MCNPGQVHPTAQGTFNLKCCITAHECYADVWLFGVLPKAGKYSKKKHIVTESKTALCFFALRTRSPEIMRFKLREPLGCGSRSSGVFSVVLFIAGNNLWNVPHTTCGVAHLLREQCGSSWPLRGSTWAAAWRHLFASFGSSWFLVQIISLTRGRWKPWICVQNNSSEGSWFLLSEKWDHLINVGWASPKEYTLPETSLRDGSSSREQEGWSLASLSLFWSPFLDHICSVARVMNLSLWWNDATYTGKLKLIYEMNVLWKK